MASKETKKIITDFPMLENVVWLLVKLETILLCTHLNFLMHIGKLLKKSRLPPESYDLHKTMPDHPETYFFFNEVTCYLIIVCFLPYAYWEQPLTRGVSSQPITESST